MPVKPNDRWSEILERRAKAPDFGYPTPLSVGAEEAEGFQFIKSVKDGQEEIWADETRRYRIFKNERGSFFVRWTSLSQTKRKRSR